MGEVSGRMRRAEERGLSEQLARLRLACAMEMQVQVLLGWAMPTSMRESGS